jgi:hypothetical protein
VAGCVDSFKGVDRSLSDKTWSLCAGDLMRLTLFSLEPGKVPGELASRSS